MLQDDGDQLGKAGDRFQNSSPGGHMLAHHPKLFVRQLARLVKDLVGSADFSNIVEQSTPMKDEQLLLRQSHHSADLDGHLSNALRMAGGPFRFCVYGPGQSSE